MITINFPELNIILTFDGTVLEAFYGDKTHRIHIGHMESIQVSTDRKGNHTLHVASIVGEIPYMEFGEQVSAKVSEFVAQVQQAMATFKFE